MTTQKVANIFDSISSFKKKDDGTYDVTSGKDVNYNGGYQVTFVRPEAFEQLSAQDWDDMTNYFCNFFDSVAHIGVYDGSAEVSFHCSSIEKAERIMKEFNQESILDWSKKQKFPDQIDSWFIVNRNFDFDKVINYGEILTKIH